MFFSDRCGIGRRWLAGTTLLAFVTALGPVPIVPAARAAPGSELARAQEHYDFAEFEQALGILDAQIAGGRLAGNDLRDAQVLRARCLVGLGNEAAAQEAFCGALRIDRQWRPDVDVFPKAERDVFERALASCTLEPAQPVTPTPTPAAQPPAVVPAVKPAKAGKPWYKQPIALVAGGALLIGGVLGLSGGGGGDGGGGTTVDPLPDFPDPPESKK